jgi:hypothetical protein
MSFRFLQRALFAATMLGFVHLANANEFNSFDAAKYNLYGSATDTAISLALGQYGNLTTLQLLERPSAAVPLTDAEIDRIVTAVNDSPFNRFGLGLVGGNRVKIEYDAAQVARMAGVKNAQALHSAYNEQLVKDEVRVRLNQGPAGVAADDALVALGEEIQPKFQVKEINTFTVSDIQNELKALQASGASVRSVTLRGLLARSSGKVVGTVQLLFVGGAVSNAAMAALNGYQGLNNNVQWQCSEGQQCGDADVLTYLFNTSNAVFYNFQAE